MPGLFITAIVFAVLTLLAGLLWRAARHAPEEDRSPRSRDDVTLADARTPALFFTVLFGVVTAACLFFQSMTIVSTKNVGIETSFGRPVGTLSNGVHFVAPWDNVTEMDAAVQTDTYSQTNHDCITVRIAHQASACVDVSIRWRINDAAADSLFQNYRDFEGVRDSLVTRELNTSMNTAFDGYDPFSVDDQGNSLAPSLNSLATKVATSMQATLNGQIEVLGVLIPVINFDPDTQGRINALQAQIAQTRIATQSQRTAQAQAQANQALAGSVSNDPNVLVSQCLTLLQDMVNKGQAIPPGFSCWPGGGSSVLVPASAGKS